MKPSNNKSIYHSAARIVEVCANDGNTVANRETMIKALKIMNDCAMYELKRLRTLHEIGDKTAKLREIEITNPEA